MFLVKEKKNESVIDNRAEIHSSAEIAEGVHIGPWCVIGPNVKIGSGTELDAHVTIICNTTLGKNNKISSFVSLGGDPQDLRYKNEPTFLEIGDNNIFREFVTVNRGSSGGIGTTQIGHGNSFFAYSHVAHDCIIGNENLFVNHATLAGHVVIDSYVTIGAFTAIHQFCRVGAYSFLSQAAMVNRDILPYVLVVGASGVPCGLNTIGLKRRGFSDATISTLKKAYHIIYRRGLKLREIRQELAKLAADAPEIDLMLELMDQSTRGVAR